MREVEAAWADSGRYGTGPLPSFIFDRYGLLSLCRRETRGEIWGWRAKSFGRGSPQASREAETRQAGLR